MVVLLYSDISNSIFWSVNILKCKNFFIGFLDELGNFKQKKILHFKMYNFFTFNSNRTLVFMYLEQSLLLHLFLQVYDHW